MLSLLNLDRLCFRAAPCFLIMRDAVKAATFEHHEKSEPSVIFPTLQKITVNVHMSAHRGEAAVQREWRL